MVGLLFAAAVAVGMIFLFRKARKNFLALPELPALGAEQPSQDVIVVIPARNEESNIARAVKSFPPGWVLVVDDASTDRTAEIAEEHSAVVLAAPPLPAGFMGKPSACAAGAKATHSDWILFADADTWYAPEFFRSLLEYAESEQLEMVPVLPQPVTESFSEWLLLPYALALSFCGVNAERVNNPKSLDALANGQCLLVHRKFYDFIGTHAAVAKSVIGDMDLALRAKRHRGQVRVVRAESMAFGRMYESFRAIWRGFSKDSFRFLRANPRAGLQMIAASLLAASWLPILLWLAYERQWIGVGLFAAMPAVLFAPWHRSLRKALMTPLAICILPFITLNGMVCSFFGKTVIWKGRRV